MIGNGRLSHQPSLSSEAGKSGMGMEVGALRCPMPLRVRQVFPVALLIAHAVCWMYKAYQSISMQFDAVQGYPCLQIEEPGWLLLQHAGCVAALLPTSDRVCILLVNVFICMLHASSEDIFFRRAVPWHAAAHGRTSACTCRSMLASASQHPHHSPHLLPILQDEDDDVVEERDPSGRFARYDQKVGKGRFKCVYKGFDEKQGIDIAWSKVLQVRSRAARLVLDHEHRACSLVVCSHAVHASQQAAPSRSRSYLQFVRSPWG